MKLPHVKTEPRALASGGLRTCRRPSFTLVELLVVIAIIGVLASLLLAAVFKVLDVAYETQTRTDITQLSASVQAFQVQFKVNYVPSRIRLREILTTYDVSNANPAIAQYESDSIAYLQRVWPRLSGTQIVINGTPVQWVDWNGDGVPDSQPGVTPTNFSNLQDPSLYVDLEGEQCLVFFLGGIPQFNANDSTFTATGFSTNVSNPSVPGGDRIAPFFDFKSNRLKQWPGTAPLFPSYYDGYGKTPYAYFSSYKAANGYNRYATIPNTYIPPPYPAYPGSPGWSTAQTYYGYYNINPPFPPNPAPQSYCSDCQALRFPKFYGEPQGLWPYAQTWSPTPQYLNSQTFQIISAGKNYQFGLGAYPGDANYPQTSWRATGASAAYPQGSDGYDDISNFYDRLLGVATQ